jgi:hypothetical protein
MNRAIGFRKIIILTECLFVFTLLLLVMHIEDASVILAIGTTLIGLISAAIYGNIKEHQHNNTPKEDA